MLGVNKTVKKIFFGKKRFQPFFKKMFALSLEGVNIGTGGRDLKETGEAFAVQSILSHEQNPIVFDVGAQGGNYSREVLSATNGQAKVYAFEPCQRDYEVLQNIFQDTITLVHGALGDTRGEATLYFPNTIQGISSLYKRDETFSQSERVTINTIDNFCQEKHIDHITLLKLDVEGHELACLRGARQMLRNIRFIQFEMSSASRDARTYFKDIFEFLSEYTIYRILKDGLEEIQSPEKITELLFTTNYIAKRKA